MVYGLYVYPVYGKYPATEPLDERFTKHYDLKDEFRVPPPMKDGKIDYGAIKRVLPNRIKWKDSAGRPAPDFDQTPFLNVSGKAKDIIESMEPGVHTFEPMEFLYSKGTAETRFWLHVGNKLDGVNGERSNMVLHAGSWRPADYAAQRGLPLPDYANPDAPSKLVFNGDVVAPYHIWIDQRLGSAPVFISGPLGDRFKAEGITGLRLDESVVACV
jgi:hypothetical protein